jgi:hypothetical protein
VNVLDQAARRAWKDAQDAVTPEALPAPRHTSRDPWPAGLTVPQGPATLVALAGEHGWEVRLTYACGPDFRTRGNALRRSIGVRCWYGQRYALIFYTSPLTKTAWEMSSSLVAGGLVGVYSRCSVMDLREYLERLGEVSPEWFADITARVTAAELRAKATAKARPRKPKEATS